MMKELLIGAAVLTAAAIPALAQTAPPAPPAPPAPVAPQAAPVPNRPVPAVPRVERVQTRAEMVAKVRAHFARLDTNRDGFLSQAEADAADAAMKAHRAGKRMGAHGDGSARFERVDSNKDGSISRDEFAKAHEIRAERPGERGMRRMHRMGGMIGGHMFGQADGNRDGRVSLQEATDSAARHFDMADVNRDGQITGDERRQMRRQMIVKHRSGQPG